MNPLHLLWIIPLSIFAGMFVRGLTRAGKESE